MIPKTRSPLQIVDNLSISSFFVKFTPELKTDHRLGRIRDRAQKRKMRGPFLFPFPSLFLAVWPQLQAAAVLTTTPLLAGCYY